MKKRERNLFTRVKQLETKSAPLLPRHLFLIRLGTGFALALALIVVSLGIGIIGYHQFEEMSWLDAFLNASMILSGMGPVGPPQTIEGKLFAGCYALFSGLAFITVVGLMFTPVVHRLLHRFHLDEKAAGQEQPQNHKSQP